MTTSTTGGTLEAVDTLGDLERAWTAACEHGAHHHGEHGHSDDSPVVEVEALPVPCCGRAAPTRHLCESWCTSNPVLRCGYCRIGGIPFVACFRVLGPAGRR